MADAVDTAKKGATGVFNFVKKALPTAAILTTVFSVAAFALGDGGLTAQTLASLQSADGITGVINVPKEGAMELFASVKSLFAGGASAAPAPAVT